jgi:lactoylglutathione lyase
MTASTSSAETQPVATAVTGHVALNVTDLNRSIEFYCDVFGFDVLTRSTAEGRRYAFLGRGDLLVLTLWEQSSGGFRPDRPGLHHLAFNVPSLGDVQSALARLEELGVPLIYDTVMAHLPGASSGGIFFEDPDGSRIEICTADGLESHPSLGPETPSCGFF